VAYKADKCYLYGFANGLDLSTYGNCIDAGSKAVLCTNIGKDCGRWRNLEVMDGYGYVGEYNVSRLWTDAKLLEIGGGTGKSHHKNVARDLHRF